MQILFDSTTDSPEQIAAILRIVLASTTPAPEPVRRAPDPPVDVVAPPAALAPAPTFPGTFSAPVPPPPGDPVPPDVDSKGVPYDARIHSASRAKKIDGTWKTKRGVETAPVTVDVGNAPSTFAVPPPPAPLVQSVVGTSVPPVTAAAPSPAIDFRGLMQKIKQLTEAGRLSTQGVNDALAGVGLQPSEMAQLIGNGPLIASVNAAIDKATA